MLLALAVVIVLTAFLSELFLDTGLEVRALQNLRDSSQAESLARSAFKAVERAIQENSEQDFATGFQQVQALLKLSPVPFEGALLTTLQVNSLDGRFNVNELGSLQPGSAEDSLRWALFRTLVTSIALKGSGDDQSPLAITDVQIAGLYSALVDWIDMDETPYVAQGAPGAERAAYATAVPPYEIKNRMLDQLEEMRLIQGWVEAGIPWPEFEARFTALPKSTQSGGSYLPERLDINLASREEISRWLTEHRIEDPAVLSSNFGTAQGNLNTLAERADAAAAALVPEGFERTLYKDMGSVQKALQAAGITATNPSNFFSLCSTYLQIRVTVDVNGMKSTLTGLVQATRDSTCGKPQSLKIFSYSMS